MGLSDSFTPPEPEENCVIWPKDTADESSPCQVHKLEIERIGWGGEYSVQGHMFDNFFLLLDGTVEMVMERKEDAEGNAVWPGVNVGIKFIEVRRRGQRIDMGGYYFNPKELPKSWRHVQFGGFDDDDES